jgi:hypothetical protein
VAVHVDSDPGSGGLYEPEADDEEILEKVRKAFAPYHVVAELQDYHRKLGFRVYDEDDEIIGTFEDSLIQDLKNPANLKRMLVATRFVIERRSKKLKPWNFEA